MQARVLARVGHDQRRGRCDDLAAEGVRQRRLAGARHLLGQPHRAHEHLAFVVDQRDQRHRHLEQARGRAREAVEGRSGRPSISSAPARAQLTAEARPLHRASTYPLSIHRLDLLGVLRRDRLALELHRRRQLVAAGQPSRPRTIVNFLICSTRDELRVGGVDARLRPPRAPPSLGGQLVQRRALDARAAPPRRARSRRRARSAPCCSGRPSPITQAWPISGLGGLQRRLDVRRRHVLAGRVDDQLLLAVDDPAGSRPRRSRRCRRCAASRRRRSPRRSARAGCGSRVITTSAAHQHLAVVGELELDARRRRPDRADLDLARAGCSVPAPQVSDMPHSSASGMPIAWKNSSTSRGVGAAPTLTASTSSRPSMRAQAGEQLCVGLGDASAASSSGTGSPACSSSTLRGRGLEPARGCARVARAAGRASPPARP